MNYLLIAALAYLIGSLRVAYWIARLSTGRDLREIGSGNVGVLSTFVNVGGWAGALTLASEAFKGGLAVYLGQRLSSDELGMALGLLGGVIGTNWSIWLRGRGGRGNTAFAGAMLLIAWPVLVVLLATWFLARIITGYSFYATRLNILILPIVLGLVTQSWIFAATGVAISAIFLSKHRAETDDHLIFRRHPLAKLKVFASPTRERDSR